MITRLSLLFVIAMPFFLHAQKPMKWGKIPREDLQMTEYPADTSAGAVVLADIGNIELDFTTGKTRVVFTRHRRIKILKPSGFEWGDVSLEYYAKNQSEKLYALKAQTITPEGEKIALKRPDFHTEKVNDDWNRKTFSFPQVSEGCVLEYTYKIESYDFYSLPKWYFQDEIPVRYSELTFSRPDFMDYVVLYQGELNIDKSSDHYMGNLYYLVVLESSPELHLGVSGSTYPLPVNVTVFKVKDMPAFKPEPYITTEEDYIASLQFQWRALIDPTDNRTQPMMSSWEQFAEKMYRSQSFGIQFSKSFWPYDMAQAVKPKLKEAGSMRDTVDILYRHLQNRMSLSKPRGVTIEKDLATLYMARKADGGELNLMLVGALRKLGIPAWPVLISTRSHGKVYRQYPILAQFNHTLAAAQIDGELLLMDLGAPHYPPGYLAVADLNYYGMLLDREHPRWIELPAPKSEHICLGDFTLDEEEGILSGTFTLHYKGYEALKQINDLKGNTDLRNYWQEALAEHYPSIEVDSVSMDELSSMGDRFSTVIYCSLPDALIETGPLTYLPMITVPLFTENPFSEEERKYPVSFPYPFKEKTVVSIHLPEGTQTESLPEPALFKLPNKGGKIKIQVVQEPNGDLRWINTFQLQQLIFIPEEYPALRNFFSLYFKKRDEPATLLSN